MNQPLQLRYVSAQEAAPDAWFLPGDSAERWLEDLARCGLANAATKLAVIAGSPDESRCAGLLVVFGTNGTGHSPAGAACRRVAGRLFVPTDAVLHPPVTDLEMQKLCGFPTAFFHPVFGLSAFEERDTIRVSDLIEPPEERTEDWNHARAGAAELPALNGVELLQPPSIGDVFGDAPSEIGTESPDDLAPEPDEPRENPAAKAGRELRRRFLEGARGAMRRLPHLGSKPNWLNRAEAWVQGRIAGVSKELEQLRNKELHRLLSMLDRDPDEGLRHAIPLSGLAHRGRGAPGGRLGRRDLKFDPRRMGGQAADYWNVPHDLQERLRRRYREMAEQEMHLGRFQRAAYIYAELLGDLVSAANALKQGGHYREAAILYEERLNNPMAAARCLADGGLLLEAIERYERLGQWLEVAGLQERLGNIPAAHAAIRRVVAERLESRDILGAARLVEERLQAPDEALEMLLGAWPDSSQAVSCLGAGFRLLSRLGRHEVSLERLGTLARERIPNSLALPLVSTLRELAQDYPHEVFRHRGADFARVLVSRQLSRTELPDDAAVRLLDQFVRLAPQDRLLSRDATRHLADRRVRSAMLPPAPAPRAGALPVVHHRFDLPRQTRWYELRREWQWFYALGLSAGRVTVVRGVWEGQFQSLSWDWSLQHHALRLLPTEEQGTALAVMSFGGGEALVRKSFPASDLFFNKSCLAGTPPWLPTNASAVAFGDTCAWTVHLTDDGVILSIYSKRSGVLQSSRDITKELLEDTERKEGTKLSLAAVRDSAVVAFGNRLVYTGGDGGLARVELAGQVTGLLPTISSVRAGVAIMLEHGALHYWLGTANPFELERDLESPTGTFVPGGPLVLLSGYRLVLLDMDSDGVRKVARMDLQGQRPVGVCATSNYGEFGVLGADGAMTIYRLPRS